MNLEFTFECGQIFRWRKSDANQYEGLLGKRFIRLVQSGEVLEIYGEPGSLSLIEIQQFLRLDLSLEDMMSRLRSIHLPTVELMERYRGLRVLSQPPVECLLSFVCAVVTTIGRIRFSLDEISRRFGEEVRDGVYAFPDLDILASLDCEQLRVGSMEFRCRNLSAAARELHSRGGAAYLSEISQLNYEEAVGELVSIPYIGRKVADCALLFSLGFDCAFPLDTHTWRLVEELFQLKDFKRTPKGYQVVSDEMRERFGEYAGWVQQYLYYHSLISSGNYNFIAGK